MKQNFPSPSEDSTSPREPDHRIQPRVRSENLDIGPPSVASSVLSVLSRPSTSENRPQTKIPRVEPNSDVSFSRHFKLNPAVCQPLVQEVDER
jgi:hypothetical protein